MVCKSINFTCPKYFCFRPLLLCTNERRVNVWNSVHLLSKPFQHKKNTKWLSLCTSSYKCSTWELKTYTQTKFPFCLRFPSLIFGRFTQFSIKHVLSNCCCSFVHCIENKTITINHDLLRKTIQFCQPIPKLSYSAVFTQSSPHSLKFILIMFTV